MKKMNKVAAAVLAVAMVGSMAVPAFATSNDTITGSNTQRTTSGNTVVKYEVTEGYEWKIHSDIDFGSNRTGATDSTEGKVITRSSNTVSVTKNTIPTNTKLVITVQGNGGSTTDTTADSTNPKAFEIKTVADTVGAQVATLTYTVQSEKMKGDDNADGNVEKGGTVLEVKAGTDSDSTSMTFILNTGKNASEFSGHYEGKVIYTASVEKAQ